MEYKEYDGKADVWSLGCVYYEMLVGTTPYRGMNPKDLYNNILNKQMNIPLELQLSTANENLLNKVRNEHGS